MGFWNQQKIQKVTEYIKEKNKVWENEKGSRKRKEYEEITMNIKKD